LKIALVTFEYPPGKNVGGIGTYFYQIANGLSNLKHQVVVFSSSEHDDSFEIINDFLTVIRVKEKHRNNFSKSILPQFIQWNKKINQFDIIEGPEYNADTREIKKQFPKIPLVLKFHTPTFWVDYLNTEPPLAQVKIRFILGALFKLKIPSLYWKNQFSLTKYNKEKDIEYLHSLEADLLTSPCLDLSNIISINWKLNKESIVHIPNPYEIKKELLDIKSENQSNKIVITFIGRLEIRKGILLMAEVIPTIFKKNKDVYFRFIGSSDPSPIPNLSMQEYILKKYKRFVKNLEFTGRISFEEILLNLSDTNICIFPSKWENFPNVCLEAMAASKAIVASQFGGMAEMLQNKKSGLLVDPNNSVALAESIQYLIDNPNKRLEYGQNARDKVLTEYSYEKILNKQVELYNQVINKTNSNG